MSALQDDLHERMAPTEAQLASARAIGDSTYVPIAFPGKEYGWWNLDTEVEHPAGVFMSRDAASLAAARYLNGRPGTVGFVWVRPDRWAVFEDILDPARLIALAEDHS